MDDTTQEFTIGSPFGDLPLYSTWTENDKKYTFVGWSLVDYTQEGVSPTRISESDIVEYGYNIIYIIWVDSDLYIVNLEITAGGTVSAAVYGTPGNPITLIITPDPYYKATTVIVTPSGGTTKTFYIDCYDEWVEGTTYASGSVVKYGGFIWTASTATSEEPGESSDWSRGLPSTITYPHVYE